MSIRNGLLAILARQPAHGYRLKARFEQDTAGAWPLNVGQVYTTLGRLERDGLVESSGQRPRQDWQITPAGRHALRHWYTAPIDNENPRDELAIKVLLAIASGEVDVHDILQQQRAATMRRLQELTRSKREADPQPALPWLLLLDALILKAEAEIKWLDLCEQRISQQVNT